MTLTDIAHAVLAEALASRVQPVSLTVSAHRLDLVIRDHRVLVEVRHGVLRIVYVCPAPGEGPATRDQRLLLDEASEAVVGAWVRLAIVEGLTPF